jgi:hypothetical protein
MAAMKRRPAHAQCRRPVRGGFLRPHRPSPSNWFANGGWEFNPNHYQQYRPNPLDPPGGTLPDTAAITNAQLMANPFFKPFTKLKIENGGAVPDSANGIDLTGSQGSVHAANYAVKAWLLAHDVPAIHSQRRVIQLMESTGKI